MNVLENILLLLGLPSAPKTKELKALMCEVAELTGALDRDDFGDPFLRELNLRLIARNEARS